jgi:acyl carrier protein
VSTTQQQAPAGRPTPDDVLALVRDAVATVLERDPAELDRSTLLVDLDADSLALVEVAEIVEERLSVWAPGVRIPDEELERFRTVGDAVDYAVGRL